jgi:hypothetical protein
MKQQNYTDPDNRPSTNSEMVNESKKRLKAKGIKSPNTTEMPFVIHDTLSRATYYFRKESCYVNKYKLLTQDSLGEHLILSHPELCTKMTTVLN